MTPEILILAAGAASRMRGGDKCLEPVAGEPLLRRLARQALAVGEDVTVVLPRDRPARAAALEGLAVRCVTAGDADKGMAASLVAGLAALRGDAAVLLVLADLPMLDAGDLRAVIAAGADDPACIARGADPDGTPGHPVLFPPDLRGELLGLRGDEGARSVLMRHAARVRLVPLPQGHATTDLDTPEDWAAWRAANG